MLGAFSLLPPSSGRYRGVAILDTSFTETDYVALLDGGIRGIRFKKLLVQNPANLYGWACSGNKP